jgi:predicted DsbA family dithiol-disulfide isomerase
VDTLARAAPLLTVAMQSGAAGQVQQHLNERGHGWTVLNDPDGAIARQLGVAVVPTFLFIDGHGRVRSVTQGYTTTLGLRVRLAWARLF